MDELILQIYILQSQPHNLSQPTASLTKEWHEEFDCAAGRQSFVIPPLQLIIGERPPFEDISSFILDKQSGEWITFVQVQF